MTEKQDIEKGPLPRILFPDSGPFCFQENKMTGIKLFS